MALSTDVAYNVACATEGFSTVDEDVEALRDAAPAHQAGEAEPSALDAREAARGSEKAPRDDDECQAEPPATRREFERALRALGFSRRQAANIASRGYGDSQDEPEPEDDTRIRRAVERLARSLRS